VLRAISKVQATEDIVKEGTMGKGEGRLLDLRQEVDDDNGNEEEGEGGGERGGGGGTGREPRPRTEGEPSQEKDDGEPETQETQETQETCGCPVGLVSQIPGSGVKLGDQQGLVLVGQVLAVGLQAICHRHLRLLATGALGLHNSKS
jgi:hypothetical protein